MWCKLCGGWCDGNCSWCGAYSIAGWKWCGWRWFDGIAYWIADVGIAVDSGDGKTAVSLI